jgi:cell volume regulation protein A
MAGDASQLFLLLSAVIVLGFLGYLAFERSRISDVLLLIAFGALVGPALHLIPADGFTSAAPFITSLALAMIMFQGGLELKADDIVKGAGRGTLLGVVGWGLSVAALSAVGHYAIHLDWLPALLLGVILGHTSSVVVFPLIAQLPLGERTRVMMGIDSALAEVLSVVSALTLIDALALHDANVADAAQAIAAQFSVAIVLGLLAGVGWARVLRWLEGRRYHYMLTLGVILALHVGVASLGGSAPISVLVFGIVLGNTDVLAKTGFRVGVFSESMRTFQGEVTFFLRTFFFVYLGLTMSLADLRDPAFLEASALLTGAILLARLVAVRVSLVRSRGAREPGAAALLSLVIPRGLATAVLASLPFAAGLAFARDYTGYALGVIVLSNLVTTLGVVVFARRPASQRVAVEVEEAPRASP